MNGFFPLLFQTQVVLPRLRSEIEVWDPRIDQRSAHLWLHPWLPLLGRKMEMLWTPIRFAPVLVVFLYTSTAEELL